MIIDLEIQAEIQLLEKLAEDKPNAAKWVQNRIDLLSRALRDFKGMNEILSNDMKRISNLELEVARANQELIQVNRALAVAKKTLTEADQL